MFIIFVLVMGIGAGVMGELYQKKHRTGKYAKWKKGYVEPADVQIRCPKCHSTQIAPMKRGFKLGRAVVGGVIGGGVLGGAIIGGIGANKVELVCLKCGRKFRA